jgi:hypothetical protein
MGKRSIEKNKEMKIKLKNAHKKARRSENEPRSNVPLRERRKFSRRNDKNQ